MATWRFDNGVTLSSGGHFEGPTKEVATARTALSKARVQLFGIPAEKTAVDVSSDFLLELFARDYAHSENLLIDSEYEPTIEDLPPKLLAELKEQLDEQRRQPFGTIY